MSIAASDVNNDGTTDLATADSSNDTATVFANDTGTPGTFAVYSTEVLAGSPQGLLLLNVKSDVNGPDLVYGEFDNSRIAVRLNGGSGTYGAASYYATTSGPLALAADNLNGDAYPDIVKVGEGGLTILTNDGNGGFTSTDTDPFGHGRSVALGDLDNDGDLDIVVSYHCCSTPYGFRVYLNQGNIQGGTLGDFDTSSPLVYSTGSSIVEVRDLLLNDFDRDGFLDLAIATDAPGIEIWTGNAGGNGAFNLQSSFALPASPRRLAVADFNNNALSDLAITLDNANLLVLPGDGNGLFGTAETFATGGSRLSAIFVTDLDLNGSPDIAVSDWDANKIHVFLNGIPVPVNLSAFEIE